MFVVCSREPLVRIERAQGCCPMLHTSKKLKLIPTSVLPFLRGGGAVAQSVQQSRFALPLEKGEREGDQNLSHRERLTFLDVLGLVPRLWLGRPAPDLWS